MPTITKRGRRRCRRGTVDLLRVVGNHNYMNTRQEDPGSADDSAGAGEDEGRDSGSGGGGEAKPRGWCTGRLPADWFTSAPDIQVDREEITIVGTLAEPTEAGVSAAERAAAAQGPIRRFREESRGGPI